MAPGVYAAYGPNRWCPGDSLYMDQGGPYQDIEWDMNVCHTWYRVGEGAGNVPEGPNNASDVWEGDNPPPPAPPAPRLPAPPGMCWLSARVQFADPFSVGLTVSDFTT
jgi:hypothetical protein